MVAETPTRTRGFTSCPHCGGRQFKRTDLGGYCFACGSEGPTRPPTREESEGIEEVNRIENTIPGMANRGGSYWK